MIEANGTVGYKKHPILREISLNICGGEGTCLIGPNGTGKSTLLNSLSGYLPFLEGQALVRGIPVEKPSAKKFLGSLADPPNLYEELTPLEHLELLQKLWPGKTVTNDRIFEMLTAFGIREIAAQPVSFLSLGQRKRLGLAVCFLHSPEFLILDEPFNGLDQEGCSTVATALEEHAASGGAFIVVTHQPRLLESLRPRIFHAAGTGTIKETFFPGERWPDGLSENQLPTDALGGPS